MKIRMLSTQKGSLDGIKVADYEEGQEYDLTKSVGARDLAQAFVGARMAIEIVGDGDGDGKEPELPFVAEPVEQPISPEVSDPAAAEAPAAADDQLTTTPAPTQKRKGGK